MCQTNKNTTRRVVFLLVEMRGIDLHLLPIGSKYKQPPVFALVSADVHWTSALKWVRFPIHKIKIHPKGWILILVEMRGIEPLSESNLERLSPGAVCYLHSLIPSGTNTLRDLVASLCVVWAKLTIRTCSTQMTPKPGSWTFRGGCAPN